MDLWQQGRAAEWILDVAEGIVVPGQGRGSKPSEVGRDYGIAKKKRRLKGEYENISLVTTHFIKISVLTSCGYKTIMRRMGWLWG